MRVVGVYSFNGGKEAVEKAYPELLVEIHTVIKTIDAGKYKTKESEEKTMVGRMLFSPRALNKAFKHSFAEVTTGRGALLGGGWRPIRVPCEYPTKYYMEEYKTRASSHGAFREMDFVKEKLGVEVQFGKYAFMVYNVCAKMTIFHKLGHINYGVEIVPVKAFAEEMSTGVSYFEQFVWDLEHRGTSNIDIPVLILGIDADPHEKAELIAANLPGV